MEHTWGGDAASGKVDNGEALETSSFLEEMKWGPDFARINVKFLVGHGSSSVDLSHEGTLVTDCLDDVASASLALGADEGSTLGDATKGLAEIACATNERDLERVLVDMMGVVRRREHLRLVDVVDTDGLHDLD